MKLITAVLVLVLGFSTSLMAGEMNEDAFKSWMSGITLDGKKFYTVEKDGETIQAIFTNPANPSVGPRMVSISSMKEFEAIQKTVNNPQMQMGPTRGFVFQGMRTVVVDTRMESGLMVFVEAKNINRTFVMTFPPESSQSAIESGLVKTGLYQK